MGKSVREREADEADLSKQGTNNLVQEAAEKLDQKVLTQLQAIPYEKRKNLC